MTGWECERNTCSVKKRFSNEMRCAWMGPARAANRPSTSPTFCCAIHCLRCRRPDTIRPRGGGSHAPGTKGTTPARTRSGLLLLLLRDPPFPLILEELEVLVRQVRRSDPHVGHF